MTARPDVDLPGVTLLLGCFAYLITTKRIMNLP